MNVKLLTEQHLELLSLKEVAKARLCLHLSKCHIVGNLMSRLNYILDVVWLSVFCVSSSRYSELVCSCADPEGGSAGGPDPYPEKLQKYRVY